LRSRGHTVSELEVSIGLIPYLKNEIPSMECSRGHTLDDTSTCPWRQSDVMCIFFLLLTAMWWSIKGKCIHSRAQNLSCSKDFATSKPQ
jgi:hypothetical protein